MSTGDTITSDNDLRDAYLRRIGVSGVRNPSVAALTELHAAHCSSVPFETLWQSESIRVEDSLRQIVLGGRGGICYHLNGAFGWLLGQLGYTVAMHRAGTQSRISPGPQQPNGTHVVLVVSNLPDATNLGGRWLLDVGAGEGFVAPLPLAPGDHVQGDFRYRVRPSDLNPSWWRLDYDRKESCRGVDFSEETVTVDDLTELYADMAETEMAIFFTYGWVKKHSATGYDELIGCQLASVGASGRKHRTITTQADYFDTLSGVFGLGLPSLNERDRTELWSRVQVAWTAESFDEKWTAQ